ncbi:hypothetical protein BU16DRAFT_538222 [Lophium mytilinum]|uniref:Uncharacterized protein n=1 Tax=Lophium mytilinum TaxID=390894 RepID=A0A6A6QXC8_9PEZI|nr:hypothetical protein BU16DRAFT_538222 [Lophium mytilinum]
MPPKRKAEELDNDAAAGTRPPKPKVARLDKASSPGSVQVQSTKRITQQHSQSKTPGLPQEPSRHTEEGNFNVRIQNERAESVYSSTSPPPTKPVSTEQATLSQPVNAHHNPHISDIMEVAHETPEGDSQIRTEGNVQDEAETIAVDTTPKYPPFAKTFTTSDEARLWRLAHITTQPYVSPSSDATIAEIASDRDLWIPKLYDAFRDISNVCDNATSAAYKNFVGNAVYHPQRIEAVCHEVLDETLALCNNGFQLESELDWTGRSRATQVEKNDRSLTCKQRVKKIIYVLKEEKQVCLDLMASPFGGQKMKIFVNAPTAYGRAKGSSRKSNDRRSKTTKAAKEVMTAAGTAAPKAPRRKKKDFRVEPDSEAEEDDERDDSAKKTASQPTSGSNTAVSTFVATAPGLTTLPEGKLPSTYPTSGTAGRRTKAEISSRPIKQAAQKRMTVESKNVPASQQSRRNTEKASTPIEHNEASISPAATQPLQRNFSSGVSHTQAHQYGVNRSSEAYPRVSASPLQQSFSYGGHTVHEDPIRQSQTSGGATASPLAHRDFNFEVGRNSPDYQSFNDSSANNTPSTIFGLWNHQDVSFQSSLSPNDGQSSVTPAAFDSDYPIRDWVHYTQASNNPYETQSPAPDASIGQIDWMALAREEANQAALLKAHFDMGKENFDPNEPDEEL